MFILLAPDGASILVRRSRGEAFRSAEARPLAADWPLRVGPGACYVLRHRPLLTSFPRVRHPRRTPAAASRSTTFSEAPCYNNRSPPRNRPHAPPPASASASTPPATATTPLSSVTTASPPPTSWPSPSRPPATP